MTKTEWEGGEGKKEVSTCKTALKTFFVQFFKHCSLFE